MHRLEWYLVIRSGLDMYLWKEGRKDRKKRRKGGREERQKRDRKGRREGVKSKIEAGIYGSGVFNMKGAGKNW